MVHNLGDKGVTQFSDIVNLPSVSFFWLKKQACIQGIGAIQKKLVNSLTEVNKDEEPKMVLV